MVRRSRRTTLGDATFALSPPWSLISSWTNSRFLSARSAFAFSIPATMATGQKRGRGRGGRPGGRGAESTGAGVSGITASQRPTPAVRSRGPRAGRRKKYYGAARDRASALVQPDAARDRLAVAGVIPDWPLLSPIPLERRAFSEVLWLMGHDAPCTLHVFEAGLVCRLAGWAGLPGATFCPLCREYLGGTCAPVGWPRCKSSGELRQERQYRD